MRITAARSAACRSITLKSDEPANRMTQDRRKDGPAQVEFIKPTPLADKVPAMGGPRPSEALRRAEDVVAKVAGEFDGILAEELADLDKLMDAYRANPEQAVLDKLFRRVHNLRGQGTTLGYPLITRIGTSFCKYIIERDTTKPLKPMLIEQHLKALHIVLKEKRAQEGDEVSLKVAEALETAVRQELP